MTFSAKALQPLRTCVLLFVQSLSRILAVIRPEQLFIIFVLLFLIILRLLPISYFLSVDHLLGRSGDGILLLVALLLLVGSLLLKRFYTSKAAMQQGPRSAVTEPVMAILDMHLQLDNEIDHKLTEVIEDTETSALLIITNVRQLYDTASNLVSYLEKSSLKGSALETEISNSVAFIVDIGSFIEKLPAKIERDLKNVQSIVNEIKELSGLVQAVHNISMQSHLLAINAAIEATRAGTSGAAFRVVADEMRSLASNSNGVATKINDGLSRARYVVEHGMAASLSESSQQLGQISMAVTAVKGLQDNFEDISQYYKTRFTVVTKHNENLAKDIADALGQIQYQDVVRQCVERIRFAIGQRNEYFKLTVDRISEGDDDLSLLPALLEMIRIDYLTEEEKHKHSARHTVGDGSELKIELF